MKDLGGGATGPAHRTGPVESSPRLPEIVQPDHPGPPQDRRGDRGEELSEGEGLDAEVGEPREVVGEGGVLQLGCVDGGDGVAVEGEVEAVVGALDVAEPARPFGDGKCGRGEVGEVAVGFVGEGEVWAGLPRP